MSEKKRIVIVNEEDEIIGFKERGTLIPERDIYRVSALWIRNSRGDILLAQRAFTKSHNPGEWGSAVAGTVDEGETYEENIIKEAEEEIGLFGYEFEKAMKTRSPGTPHNYFTQWFTFSIDEPVEFFTIQEEEVADLRWFGEKELREALARHPEKFLPSLPKYLELFSEDRR